LFKTRSEILDLLYTRSRPGASRESYWTGYAIARELKREESSVWKVVDKFSNCGILEPKPKTKTPIQNRSERYRTTARTYRATVPCRITQTGKRIAELMRFARQQGIFELEPQKERITNNPTLLRQFEQAGFSKADVATAVECGLIYEAPSKSYAPMEGLATPQNITASFSSRIVLGYRYRYKER